MRGLFITFEGTDGAGKSTQMRFLNEYLVEKGFDTLVTREPGGCSISEAIRKILLDKENTQMDARAEALLYAAARAQHVEEVILPAVKAGKIVLCDRFIDSSYAYQGFGRDLGLENVMAINQFAIRRFFPDKTIFLLLPPDKAFKRMNENKEHDRLESAGEEFHYRVFKGFLTIAELFPDRIVTIDVKGTKQETHELVKQAMDAVLKKAGML
jgi:dTMP kinase